MACLQISQFFHTALMINNYTIENWGLQGLLVQDSNRTWHDQIWSFLFHYNKSDPLWNPGFTKLVLHLKFAPAPLQYSPTKILMWLLAFPFFSWVLQGPATFNNSHFIWHSTDINAHVNICTTRDHTSLHLLITLPFLIFP